MCRAAGDPFGLGAIGIADIGAPGGALPLASFARRTNVARSGDEAVPGERNMLRLFGMLVFGFPIFCDSLSSAAGQRHAAYRRKRMSGDGDQYAPSSPMLCRTELDADITDILLGLP